MRKSAIDGAGEERHTLYVFGALEIRRAALTAAGGYTTIDKATGELVERSTYQAFGAAESDYRAERSHGFREDHRFTGKEEDVEVGVQYFGARYYAPLLGRWLSADPLAVHGLGADGNVYAYVHGEALKATDPRGLQALPATPLGPPPVAVEIVTDLTATVANDTVPATATALSGAWLGLAFVVAELVKVPSDSGAGEF